MGAPFRQVLALVISILRSWNGLLMTNALAYLVSSSVMKEKVFVTILGTELHKNLNHLGLNYKPFYGRNLWCSQAVIHFYGGAESRISGASYKRRFVYSKMTRIIEHRVDQYIGGCIPIALEETRIQKTNSYNLLMKCLQYTI